jgi:hypothetical protein
VPRPNVILCSKKKIEFLGECSLISRSNVFLVFFPVVGRAAIPIIPFLKAAPEGLEGICWWNRRIVLVAREGKKKGIKRATGGGDRGGLRI